MCFFFNQLGLGSKRCHVLLQGVLYVCFNKEPQTLGNQWKEWPGFSTTISPRLSDREDSPTIRYHFRVFWRALPPPPRFGRDEIVSAIFGTLRLRFQILNGSVL